MAWQDTRPYKWRMGNLHHNCPTDCDLIVGRGRFFLGFPFSTLHNVLGTADIFSNDWITLILLCWDELRTI